MKKIFKFLIYILILSAIVFQFQSTIFPISGTFFDRLKTNFTYFFLRPDPCTQPIKYTLGTFDKQFGISQKYFLEALREAEMIWEKPFGKELFQYKNIAEEDGVGDSVMKINLIYDYRQQATSKLASLGIVVKDSQASYDSLKTKFLELKKELELAKSDYDKEVQSFNADKKVYEDKVQYWNARGGAQQKEYEELQIEKLALNEKVAQLKILQNKINVMVDEINAMVVVLNRLVGTLNISVEKYNTVGEARGESFEEGVYSSDGFTSEIDIYEFSSRIKLVRVLTHELGHALGLDHVEDSKAIMYKFNQGNNQILTQTDLDALKLKCEVR